MDHLEYLKNGFEQAQKRFQETQQRMAAMQAEFNVVVQEFNAWQTLYRAEMAKQGTAPLPPTQPTPPRNIARATGLHSLNTVKTSQTDAVRIILKERPAGMTPSEIWKEVESQFVNRTYLYSVLKRLKEKGDAIERRGRYYPKPQPEAVVVQ